MMIVLFYNCFVDVRGLVIHNDFEINVFLAQTRNRARNAMI